MRIPICVKALQINQVVKNSHTIHPSKSYLRISEKKKLNSIEPRSILDRLSRENRTRPIARKVNRRSIRDLERFAQFW